ncbi:hypothetical protein DH2020_041873 [Rehmannia glutinosa]|uniref:Uncharacterized protein n=1 Tax=Rehmannia glutinosa TaxID=99300 RepID=A0ABR0UR04_REHGL
MEGNEMPNGWPLGLGNMNSRIRMVGTSQLVAVSPPQSTASCLHRSLSFSSFSSSNLDTESTASFFPDQSVSLGRLIGIKAANKGRLYYEHDQNLVDERSDQVGLRVPKGHTYHSYGFCVPLLHHVIGRMAPTGRR